MSTRAGAMAAGGYRSGDANVYVASAPASSKGKTMPWSWTELGAGHLGALTGVSNLRPMTAVNEAHPNIVNLLRTL